MMKQGSVFERFESEKLVDLKRCDTMLFWGVFIDPKTCMNQYEWKDTFGEPRGIFSNQKSCDFSDY